MKVIITCDPDANFSLKNETYGINSYHSLVTNSIGSTLQQLGHRVEICEADIDLEAHLRRSKPDFVFNTSIRDFNGSDNAFAPGILEKLGIPFSGPSAKACSNAYDKYKTIEILQKSGIRAPKAGIIFTRKDINFLPKMDFPVFIKPRRGGCSQGISNQNFIEGQRDYLEKVVTCIETIKAPIIIEEFLPGREFTVGIFGNSPAKALPIIEFDYKNQEFPFRSFSRKMNLSEREACICPAKLNYEEKESIESLAVNAYRAIECRDYARIDIRLDVFGNPNVLEVNAIPNLEPENSSFAMMADAAGMTFINLIEKIVDLSLKRQEFMNSTQL